MELTMLLWLFAGLVALVAGGELLVKGATRLASTLGIPPVIIGLTVVAFGTSTPELAVSLRAALDGNADIAVSNVVGSNTFNILFILGVSALIRPLVVQSQMIKREVPVMIVTAGLLYFFSRDQDISRTEGILLFLGILGYTGWLVREALKYKSENQELERESAEAFPDGAARTSGGRVAASFLLVLLGLGIVMLGADWMVTAAVGLAKQWGVSDTVIGLTIVAAGTSLPEVVASVVATYRGERDIAVGNVVGSNIYNVLAILGLSGTIVPGGLHVTTAIRAFDLPFMVGVSLLCLPFFWTGRRLSRTEGTIFLALYVGYTSYLVATATQ